MNEAAAISYIYTYTKRSLRLCDYKTVQNIEKHKTHILLFLESLSFLIHDPPH